MLVKSLYDPSGRQPRRALFSSFSNMNQPGILFLPKNTTQCLRPELDLGPIQRRVPPSGVLFEYRRSMDFCCWSVKLEVFLVLQIFHEGQLLYYIDGRDENKSSWMRYIRCARHRDEQNMFAFQYCGHIYYRAFQDIPATTELLVWYDDKYPQYMGIPLEICETSPRKPLGKIWSRGEVVICFTLISCI